MSLTGRASQRAPFRSASAVTQGTALRRPVSAVCANHQPSRASVSALEQAEVSRRQLFSAFALASTALVVQLPQPAYAQGELPPATGAGADLDGVVTLISEADLAGLTPSEKQVYNLNRRIQAQQRAPREFPGFIREGFNVKVVGSGYSIAPSGLLYKDFEEGVGSTPVDGQEVIFQYTGYNESAAVIDTSFKQGRPARIRLGINGLIPGFEEGIRSMKVGTKRRIIVPPALGPPVGPSTFFSAKQCEVFDVELLDIKTCVRRQVAMFSDVVCE